jgi:hypothetical protein
VPKWLTNDPVLQSLVADLIPLFGIGSIAMTMGSMAWTLVGSQGRYRLATAVGFAGSWIVTTPLAALFSVVLNIDLQGQTAAVVIGYMVSGTLNTYILLRSDWEKLSKQVIESHSADHVDVPVAHADTNETEDHEAEPDASGDSVSDRASIRSSGLRVRQSIEV